MLTNSKYIKSIAGLGLAAVLASSLFGTALANRSDNAANAVVAGALVGAVVGAAVASHPAPPPPPPRWRRWHRRGPGPWGPRPWRRRHWRRGGTTIIIRGHRH